MNDVLPPRVVADGAYSGTIADACLISFAWRRTAENPHGLCVRTRVRIADEQGPADLFDSTDITHTGRVASIFDAAGVELPDEPIDRCIRTLIGKPVTIVAKAIVPRQGKHQGRKKSVVGGFVPAEHDSACHAATAAGEG